ncbi:MAG: hypothetical protein ABW174_05790, partial [Flavitalea sp.]
REAEMDKFIQPFRKKFPLKQKVEDSAVEQAVYESLVVNGLEMLEKCQDHVNWDDKKGTNTLGELLTTLPPEVEAVINDVSTQAGLSPAVKAAGRKIIIEEIDRMADSFDALGDLALSESVYQIVKGNHVRAAAVLDAVAKGRNIPEPEVIETLRSGVVVTHRVVINFETNTGAGTTNEFDKVVGWSNTPTLLAAAEPSLNKYIGDALGKATGYKCLITITDADDISTQSSYSLSELNLQPVDLYSLSGGGEELKAVITHKIIIAEDPGSKVQVDLTQMGPDADKGDQPISRAFTILGKIGSILSNARFAGSNDTIPPHAMKDHTNEGSHNVTEYEQRIFKTFDEMELLLKDLSNEIYVKDVIDGKTAADKIGITAADHTQMLAYMDRAMQIGINNAYGSGLIINNETHEHYKLIHQQILLITKELLTRATAAIPLKTSIGTITKPSLKVQKLAELAKTVLGKNKIILPLYQSTNTPEIDNQLSLPKSERISRHGGNMAVEKWLQGVSRVRKSMNHFSSILQWKDMMGHKKTDLQPVQLPFASGDYWLGIEYPENYQPKGDRVSVMLVNPKLLTKQTWNTGLVLDEWIEIIPVKEETSGIVFNYNQPNATPPQSILLAVTPSVTNKWEWDDLVHTVIDTVELGKIRAVEPDHINKSYLSLAMNAIVGEIPPPQVEGEDANALGVQAVMDFSFITKTED